ncbi:UNVERIFIED_CONTAM: putative phosphoribosylformylglycinamidine synthase, chloroplastic/mitochondrial [Sesamum radiatum]|uniref:phosphoribosylformylglycinamidine synthase n=1 Tax=Sesamum radiatum TaxID=300843 RepID=A0AAW2NFZ0_SESRA
MLFRLGLPRVSPYTATPPSPTPAAGILTTPHQAEGLRAQIAPSPPRFLPEERYIAMAAACEITAAEFLQTNRLLWGTLAKKSPSVRISHGEIGLRPVKVRAVVSRDIGSPVSQESKLVGRVAEKVVHFYRIPLIQESATAELLKLVQTKVSNQIIGLKTEQCFNIGVVEIFPVRSFQYLGGFWGKPMSLIIWGLLERSRRYMLYVAPGSASLSDSQIAEFAALVHDRMTECIYNQKLTSFETNVVPEEVRYIPVMEKGRKALEEINEEMGLAFDEQDLKYYTKLFMDDIQRNPTNVELFDIAQSNSEHSRHWFFTGLTCPLDMSARDLDILFTAETHNFPCAVAPYPGAETGAGGRIRDTHATGRGSFVVASTAGYCVGNLNVEGSYAPWEDPTFTYPANLASPLQILIDASNGASDYGNKFGEPLIQGEPEIGMLVVKIGGPAYRIGMGGGAASSMVSGQNDAELDFNAVQRGDAEMAQKLYRVVRACVEMGEKNPIISIHDQGAGGTEPLDIAPGITVMDSLKRVLRLPSVASKRFLTTKVDRCVTGLVAQQQTVGPLQITLSDVAVIAQSYTDITGGACSIGEQPIKGLLDPKAMARLAVGEALTNLVWAKITSLSDVKASGNWMYAAKLDGEGAAMYDAAIALSEAMIELGIAIDGGKDSLSMAAHASGEVVKAPGNLVISTYVTCPDITKTVTPDLKLGDDGLLLHIDLAKGKRRLGGSALAQVFDQVGDECPDLDDVSYLKRVFNAVQNLIEEELISAGHDISDGGLLTLFAEELGLILEIDGITHLTEETSVLRDLWEETSFQLKKFQRLASCVELERKGLRNRHEPSWVLTFTPIYTDEKYMTATSKPKVAIIREEGSNGDREMSGAFYAAGFEPWDITMSDLLNGAISLHEFRGIAFVGGFSYADVLDSAKGWAASIRFNKPLLKQFQEFYERPDTFSLGVCNGCQLMALLGWVPGPNVGGVLGDNGDPSQPRFIHNESGRFECRFTSVKIEKSPALMFKGMEGSTLGVWAAHGEGRAYFPDDNVFNTILKSDLAPVKYCDDNGNPTEVYPFNLNGSPLGVAAICSPDGRHLAMMPHPERCFLMWQYPWYPKNWNVEKKGPSPWLRMFQNAREWCS